MSTKKRGMLTTSGEWKKHLRRWGKRIFWRSERQRVAEFFRNFTSKED